MRYSLHQAKYCNAQSGRWGPAVYWKLQRRPFQNAGTKVSRPLKRTTEEQKLQQTAENFSELEYSKNLKKIKF